MGRAGGRAPRLYRGVPPLGGVPKPLAVRGAVLAPRTVALPLGFHRYHRLAVHLAGAAIATCQRSS